MRRSILHARYLRDSAPGGDPAPGVGGGGGASTAPAATTVTPTVVPPAATPVTPAPAETKPGDGLPEDPAALKAEILRLRGENASSRATAKATAADEARKQLTADIAKALGLAPDDTDPAKLTEQLTAAKTSQTEAARELAVFKAAATAGAKPDALLDSRAFIATIADLDPADSAAITQAITDAVKANPALGAAPTAGASTVDHAGGSGEGPQPKGKPQKTMAEAVANTLRLS